MNEMVTEGAREADNLGFFLTDYFMPFYLKMKATWEKVTEDEIIEHAGEHAVEDWLSDGNTFPALTLGDPDAALAPQSGSESKGARDAVENIVVCHLAQQDSFARWHERRGGPARTGEPDSSKVTEAILAILAPQEVV